MEKSKYAKHGSMVRYDGAPTLSDRRRDTPGRRSAIEMMVTIRHWSAIYNTVDYQVDDLQLLTLETWRLKCLLWVPG